MKDYCLIVGVTHVKFQLHCAVLEFHAACRQAVHVQSYGCELGDCSLSAMLIKFIACRISILHVERYLLQV